MAISIANYGDIDSRIVELLEASRRAAARSVNALMTATYWEIGRRIVEFEQQGAERAAYGDELIRRLAGDLTSRFGRGFSPQNLAQMRAFFRTWPNGGQFQAGRGEAIFQTLSGKLDGAPGQQVLLSAGHPVAKLVDRLPLPWSAYVRLLAVKNPMARSFYETEALRGGLVGTAAGPPGQQPVL